MVSFSTVYQRVVDHWRAIVLLLILARVAFLVASSDEFVSFELNLFALLLIFIASQVFWIGRIVDLAASCRSTSSTAVSTSAISFIATPTDGTKSRARNSTSTAASASQAFRSGLVQGLKLRCWNWCVASDLLKGCTFQPNPLDAFRMFL